MVLTSQREPFVNRTTELDALEQLARDTGVQPHQHAALIGLRRTGKSVLAREFVRRKRLEGLLAATMNCDTVDDEPEAFMYRMVRTLLIAAKPDLEKKLDLDTPSAMRPELRSLPGDLESRVETLFLEAERKKPSGRDLVNGALLLPQRLAEQSGKKVVVCLDEFPSVLRLKRKRGLGSLEGMIREVFEERSPNVLFIISGSAVRRMRELLEGDAPLLTRVRRMPVATFDHADTEALIDALLEFRGHSMDPKARDDLLHFAADNPFYVSVLIRRAGALAHPSEDIQVEHLREALRLELTEEEGDIAAACQWIFDKSLADRGGEEDRRLLRELARFEAPALVTDLTSALGWDRYKTHRHVRLLEKARVLRLTAGTGDRLASFADPVFAAWVERESGHVGPSTEDIVGVLRKQLHRQSSQSGKWYESYIKVAMEEFDGQRWPSGTFGLPGTGHVQLPSFLELEMNPTGFDKTGEVHGEPKDVEADVYAVNGEGWLAEGKTESGKATQGDLELLERKAAWFRKHQGRRIDRLWFVSLNGFNPAALAYAEANGIYVTKGSQLKVLWSELQQRAKQRRARAQAKP